MALRNYAKVSLMKLRTESQSETQYVSQVILRFMVYSWYYQVGGVTEWLSEELTARH